jgi:hypothetical protein
MGRLNDWQARLGAYLADCRARSFEIGRHDCALFAAGAVEAMTGHDPAAEWRGRYTTQRGGLRVLRRAGFRDHIAAVAAQFPEIPVPSALPGDLAVINTDDGPALGVMQGAAIYVLGPGGLGLMPRNVAARAFRVN